MSLPYPGLDPMPTQPSMPQVAQPPQGRQYGLNNLFAHPQFNQLMQMHQMQQARMRQQMGGFGRGMPNGQGFYGNPNSAVMGGGFLPNGGKPVMGPGYPGFDPNRQAQMNFQGAAQGPMGSNPYGGMAPGATGSMPGFMQQRTPGQMQGGIPNTPMSQFGGGQPGLGGLFGLSPNTGYKPTGGNLDSGQAYSSNKGFGGGGMPSLGMPTLGSGR